MPALHDPPAPLPARRRAVWLLALLALWLAAWGLSQRIPPMQSPDEHSHLARAYLLCRGQWLLQTPPGQSSGGLVDRQLGELMHATLRLARDANLRLSPAEADAMAALRWSGDEAFLPIPGTGYAVPWVYLPQAAGLCLGRALGWTVLDSYRLARTLTLTASLLCLVAACRWWSPGPLALLLLALPMSLFQWFSPTVDGLTHAATLWLACVFVHLHAQERNPAPALQGVWLLVLTAVAAGRPHLLPLFVLPLGLAWRWRNRALAAATVLGLLAAGAWYAWAAATVVDQRVVRDVGLAQVAWHYLAHPGTLADSVGATLSDPQTLLFYGRSFVGILGWLDTMLPTWAYPALGGALLATALLSALRGWVGPAAPWLLAAALASVPLVFAALLLGWTAFPATRIEGVQGRYFLAPALLAAVALAAPQPEPAGAWRRGAGVAAAGVAAVGALLCVHALWLTLSARYH